MNDFIKKIASRIFRNKTNECEISIGDIFLQQGASITETQFIATSRYLDIKCYCENGVSDFIYKNTFCKTFFTNHHNELKSNRNFISLIESFISIGFNPSFPVELNAKGYMYEGNHRCGACLYFKIEKLRARIVTDGRRVDKNIDNYVNDMIDPEILLSVKSEFDRIQDWLVSSGNTFALKISEYMTEDKLNGFSIRLGCMCTILKIIKSANSILFQFSLSDPKYTYLHGKLISIRCLEIENILKNTYVGLHFIIGKSCYEGHDIYMNFKNGEGLPKSLIS